MSGGQMKKWVGGNGMDVDEDDSAVLPPSGGGNDKKMETDLGSGGAATPQTTPPDDVMDEEATAATTQLTAPLLSFNSPPPATKGAETQASSFEQTLITLFKNSTGVNLNTDMVGQVVQTAIEEAQKKTKEMMQTGGGPVLNSGTGDVEMSISESSGGEAVQPEGVGEGEDKFDEMENMYQQQLLLQQRQQQQQQPGSKRKRGVDGGKKTRRKHKRIHKKSRRKPRKSVSPGRWLRKPKRYSRNKRFKLRKRNTQNRKTKKRKTTRRKKEKQD